MEKRSLAMLGLVLGLATLPANAADTFRIVFGSCAHQAKAQDFWAPMIAERPDLFMLVGDNVYGDVSGPEMTELKSAYDTLSGHDGFRRLKATAPLVATWDDHDYGRNDAGVDFPHKAKAEALFEGFFPAAPGSDRDSRPGIHDAWTFGADGQRVQVILLDTRSFRDALRPTDERDAPGKERYVPDYSPEKTMLGPAQWAWLEARLREPADLRVIVSSIQVIADGHGFERWGNLPIQRDKLYRLVAETRANGVIFVSGDRHRAGLYRLDGKTQYPLYEITSSSLNLPFAGSEAGPHRLGAMFGDANFGVITVEWSARRVSLDIKGMDGQVARRAAFPLSALERDGP